MECFGMPKKVTSDSQWGSEGVGVQLGMTAAILSHKCQDYSD